MRKYLIERALPEVGRTNAAGFRKAAETSNDALARLAPDIQWLQSFVTDDALFCLYLATDAELVRRHAELSGFPATRILEVRTMIDPTTSTAPRAVLEVAR